MRGPITGRCKRFSLFQNAHTGSETHSAAHQIGTWELFPSGKAAGVWSWPYTEVKNECTCTSTPPASFETGSTGTTARFYLFSSNNHCPIQLIQSHYQLTEVGTSGRRVDNTRSLRQSTAFPIKVGNGVQCLTRKSHSNNSALTLQPGRVIRSFFLRLTSEIKKKRSRALVLWTWFCHSPFCTLWQINSGRDTGETPTSDADMCHFSSTMTRIFFVSFS